MSDLHADLKRLAPIDWSDVPLNDLVTFAKETLGAGQSICNSVPPPPGGEDFLASTPTATPPKPARCADDLVNSTARPQVPDQHVQKLREQWGNPVKLTPAENSQGITIYKMAGKDRHGAWFARHSITEGLSYTRFRNALQQEFATSMAVQDGPGSGAVRGLAADKRIEHHDIPGVGRLEVYQHSAQFPGPTSPREFVPLIVVAESTVSAGLPEGRAPAQQYMVASKPVTHPEVPIRDGWIRGSYESVEMIREIPLDCPADARPVQWIQVSRSDPGGSIPRFMVERGTPAAVCADSRKFLEWACSRTTATSDAAVADQVDSTTTVPSDPSTSIPSSTNESIVPKSATITQHASKPPATRKSVNEPQYAGIAFHLTNALEAGLDQYAPAIVADYAKTYIQNATGQHADDDESDTSDSSVSDSSSQTSFESADDGLSDPRQSNDSLPVSQSSASRAASLQGNTMPIANKDVQKLGLAERKAHDKLEKKTRELTKKTEERKSGRKSDAEKIQARHDKKLVKARERHDKEVSKLQGKRDREIEKARRKRDRMAHADVLDRVVRERDGFREECERLGRENEALRRELQELQVVKNGQAELAH